MALPLANAASSEIFLPDEAATFMAGASLGRVVLALGVTSLMVALKGDLGAGKTTFAKGFGEALGLPKGEVASPTFALAHEHLGSLAFSHLDLYRLESDSYAQFLEAGLEERLLGLCLVEWPERLPEPAWPEERLELLFAPKGAGRTLEGLGRTDLARKAFELMARDFFAGLSTCA